ncbi:MAG: hypothetical protein OIF58_05635, partial [Cohaesibacter sp.]|nr:hypothetical protein [Cohaesibacter sp.]
MLHIKGVGLRQIVDFFTEPFLIEMHQSYLPDCLIVFLSPSFDMHYMSTHYISNFLQLFWGHCFGPIRQALITSPRNKERRSRMRA